MSTDITNMQISGIPVIMYGMIGITTAVLAFVTLNSGGLVTDSEEQASENSNEQALSVTETPAVDSSPEQGQDQEQEVVQQGGKKKHRKSKNNARVKSKSKTKRSKKDRHAKKSK